MYPVLPLPQAGQFHDRYRTNDLVISFGFILYTCFNKYEPHANTDCFPNGTRLILPVCLSVCRRHPFLNGINSFFPPSSYRGTAIKRLTESLPSPVHRERVNWNIFLICVSLFSQRNINKSLNGTKSSV